MKVPSRSEKGAVHQCIEKQFCLRRLVDAFPSAVGIGGQRRVIADLGDGERFAGIGPHLVAGFTRAQEKGWSPSFA